MAVAISFTPALSGSTQRLASASSCLGCDRANGLARGRAQGAIEQASDTARVALRCLAFAREWHGYSDGAGFVGTRRYPDAPDLFTCHPEARDWGAESLGSMSRRMEDGGRWTEK